MAATDKATSPIYPRRLNATPPIAPDSSTTQATPRLAPELMPNPEQRAEVYRRIRAMRETKGIFAMDFQNDAEYVGGCIAGGRRYLHINANGDVDPCVFIHYSDSNIREKSLQIGRAHV